MNIFLVVLALVTSISHSVDLQYNIIYTICISVRSLQRKGQLSASDSTQYVIKFLVHEMELGFRLIRNVLPTL